MAKHPDIELYGIYTGSFGKAHLFQADYWTDAEFLPSAHSWFTPDPLAETPGRGLMRIAGWLAHKNGWSEVEDNPPKKEEDR